MTSIPYFKGLVWRSAWEAPSEGVFSIAAKVAYANELKFATVCDWVFSTNETTALLGSEVVRPILCSDRVRYCRKCMASCYHAWLFQLWYFDTCPIHDQPLRTTCESCLAPTSQFPYSRRTKTSVDLRCPRCTEPYGLGRSGLSPAGWGQIDGVEKITAAAANLQWLSRAIPITARLINGDQWAPAGTVARKDQAEEALRGKALFQILEALYGPDQGRRYLDIGLFHESVGGAPVRALSSPPPSETGDLALRLKAELGIENFGGAIVKPSFGGTVPVSSKIPPWVHAVSLWRLQHEGFPESPTLLDLSAGRFQADWLAASMIAMSWHRTLVEIEVSSDQPVRTAALLSTEEHWTRCLGRWVDRNFSPVLHIADSTQKLRAVI